MRRVFKTKVFARWSRKAGLPDKTLCQAVDEMTQGLIDADLGGNVIKKRVALPGRGKRGSTRTLIGTNLGDRWFFLYGFEKNERDNIRDDELKALRNVAQDLLGWTPKEISTGLMQGILMEICHDH